MDAQIAALGPKDFVMPFQAVGAKAYAVEDLGQAREQVKVILQENVAVLLVHEALVAGLADILQSVEEHPTPCVVALPFIEPSTGQAVQQLRTALRRATGTDIWAAAEKTESGQQT